MARRDSEGDAERRSLRHEGQITIARRASKETTTRLPMPTALMAATASAKRAEPPPMVVQTQKTPQDR